MKQLSKLIKGKVKFNEKMSRHTTFKIGGAMEEWVEPVDLKDLRKVIKFGKEFKKPIYVIGGGSNLLVNDKRIKATAVRLSGPSFEYVDIKKNRVIAGAGLSLATLLTFCIKKGLRGLEFTSGVPGTVGGALVMNAGMSRRDAASNIGNFVNRVTVMDRSGRIRVIKKRDLHFGYRTSSVDGLIILEVGLVLPRARKDCVKRHCKMILDKKIKTQDFGRPSAGCIFKNPYGGFISAGKLIELAGLKAKRIGGAQVSRKNANYIINSDGARFRDVKRLIDIIKKKVKEEFNIELELEVRIWE